LASWSRTLSELQGENAPWRWIDTDTRALEKIKELVNSPQIRKHWDHFSEAPKYLVCDASDIGLGSWIEQGELGSIRPCRFHSRKFSPAQLKYPTYQKELLAIVDSLKYFEAQLRDHKFRVLTDHQPLLSFLRPWQTSQKLARLQAYMREFDLLIEHTAGKDNLLADAQSRKHKYSLDPTEEQDFIPQSMNPTEHNSTLQDTSITTNNLSISPVPEEITMVSRGCINFKHMDCDYNKCVGHDESLGHHPSCLYLDDENDGHYEDYDDIKEEEMLLDEDTLSTIPEEIFDGAPADDTSSVPNDDNIPVIITDVVNDAWEQYKQHQKEHNMDCHDYYFRSHGISHQNGNRYFPTTRCTICGTYRHGCLDCTLAEAVYQKEKEFQSSQRDSWKLQATTIPPNNTHSF